MFKALKSWLPFTSLVLSLALSLSAIYYEFLHEEHSRKRYIKHSHIMETKGIVEAPLIQTELSEQEDQSRARTSKENAKLREQLAYKLSMTNLLIEEQGRKSVTEHGRLAEAARQRAAKQENQRAIEHSRQVKLTTQRAEQKERQRLIAWNSQSEMATQHAEEQERMRLDEQRRQVDKANHHAEEQERLRLEEQRRHVEKSNQHAEEKERQRIQDLATDEDKLS